MIEFLKFLLAAWLISLAVVGAGAFILYKLGVFGNKKERGE